MKMKHVLSAGLGMLALGLVATTAQAAPLAGPGSVVDAQAGQASLVEKTTWWGYRHYGHRHHYYGYRYYKPYSYGYYKPYYGYYYPRHYYYRHHYRHWY
jgi:hypothetical protein